MSGIKDAVNEVEVVTWRKVIGRAIRQRTVDKKSARTTSITSGAHVRGDTCFNCVLSFQPGI